MTEQDQMAFKKTPSLHPFLLIFLNCQLRQAICLYKEPNLLHISVPFLVSVDLTHSTAVP